MYKGGCVCYMQILCYFMQGTQASLSFGVGEGLDQSPVDTEEWLLMFVLSLKRFRLCMCLFNRILYQLSHRILFFTFYERNWPGTDWKCSEAWGTLFLKSLRNMFGPHVMKWKSFEALRIPEDSGSGRTEYVIMLWFNGLINLKVAHNLLLFKSSVFYWSIIG